MSETRTREMHDVSAQVTAAERKRMQWDSEAIFTAAGGTGALRRMLVDAGFAPPKADTIYVWRARGIIPHCWAASCIYVVLRAGKAKLSELLK